MKDGDLFTTQYIIWDNFGMEKQDKNLASYEIGAEVLDRLGIHEGLLTMYHQNYANSSTYLQDLETLAYDMLYGENYIYGGESPFKETDMKMGVKAVSYTHLDVYKRQ